MSRLEDALREALKREAPPEGFAERVLARVDREAAEKPERAAGRWDWLLVAFRGPRLRWATALAAVALIVGGVEYRNEREKRIEGERAKAQVMFALRITEGKLRFAQERLQNIIYAKE